MGFYAGQWHSVKLLLEHQKSSIGSWDASIFVDSASQALPVESFRQAPQKEHNKMILNVFYSVH